jgi:uncharacterized membrane protein
MLICARCLGFVAGQIGGAGAVLCGLRIPTGACVALVAVLLGDWLLQEWGVVASTNRRRLMTGLLGSLGLTALWLRLSYCVAGAMLGHILANP